MLPEPDRVAFFKEELTPLLNFDIELLTDEPPRHAMSFVQAGPVGLSSIHVSPTAFHRTRRHAGESDDAFFFNPMTAGWQQFTSDDVVTRLDVGEGCLLHVGSAGVCHLPEGGSAFGIRIDGAALRALVRRPEDMIGRPIGPGQPGMALLMGYLRSFSEARDTLTPQLLHSFGLHVVDLVGSILGATRDGSAEAEAGGVRAARLRRVLDRIAERACDPHFSVEAVAAELSVTSRTIQLVLEEGRWGPCCSTAPQATIAVV